MARGAEGEYGCFLLPSSAPIARGGGEGSKRDESGAIQQDLYGFAGRLRRRSERTLYVQERPAVDSAAHLSLISELEDAFDVMFESEDVLHYGSYENGKAILRKYGVDI